MKHRVPPSLSLPAALLVLQALLVVLAPPTVSRPAAYLSMVLAPLLAAVAVGWRSRRAVSSLRTSWGAVAVSLGIWAAGAFGNLWQELVLGHADEMYAASMLAFNLAAVPITFVLASEGRTRGRAVPRLIDAVLASALGSGFFWFTWATLNARGAPDDAGVQAMLWLLDAQSLYLLLGALVRWYAADDQTERHLFGLLSAYCGSYLVLLFVNNHLFAGDPGYGPEYGTIISLAFALAGGLALAEPRPDFRRAPPWLVRTVRSASPIMVVGALLIVSLFMIRFDYAVGTAGVVLAMVGYVARNTLSQVRFIEHGESLQRAHSQLESIAFTDALTGVPNRRFLERALERATDPAAPAQTLAVLMVDIDHFKQLNDLRGHQAGDACLRQVAQALKGALGRPGDVLARYGGEEFLALLRDTNREGAAAVAERLRAAVEQLRLPHPGSPSGVVTVSVGLASAATDDAAAAAELVTAADNALYEAKRAGRNQVKGLVVTSG